MREKKKPRRWQQGPARNKKDLPRTTTATILSRHGKHLRPTPKRKWSPQHQPLRKQNPQHQPRRKHQKAQHQKRLQPTPTNKRRLPKKRRKHQPVASNHRTNKNNIPVSLLDPANKFIGPQTLFWEFPAIPGPSRRSSVMKGTRMPPQNASTSSMVSQPRSRLALYGNTVAASGAHQPVIRGRSSSIEAQNVARRRQQSVERATGRHVEMLPSRMENPSVANLQIVRDIKQSTAT